MSTISRKQTLISSLISSEKSEVFEAVKLRVGDGSFSKILILLKSSNFIIDNNDFLAVTGSL